MTDRFHGAKVTIVGLAREGTSLARYLIAEGASVRISDSRSPAALGGSLRQVADLPVHLVLGGNRLEDAIWSDYLFLSPGVPLTIPMVEAARAAGIPIESEPKLFVERCPAPVIGVTGSSGKTTTTSLIGAMLEASGRRTFVGGNIGRPLIGLVDTMRPDDGVVLELSSFQLALFDRSPAIAVVTTLSPDHLDRHASLEEYYLAKRQIVCFQRPSDIAVLNADSVEVRRFADGLLSEVRWFSLNGPVDCGAYLENDRLWLVRDGQRRPILRVTDLALPGRHNVANVLAAAVAADAAGTPIEAIGEAARRFRGVKHRLELVETVGGVRFYNDSIATSPERTIAALDSFDGRIIWLAGGRDKNLPLDGLAAVAARRVQRAELFGESQQSLADALRNAGFTAFDQHADLAGAFAAAVRSAAPGDVVLLSPACTSFDQFPDYEVRGETFRALVHALAPRPEDSQP